VILLTWTGRTFTVGHCAKLAEAFFSREKMMQQKRYVVSAPILLFSSLAFMSAGAIAADMRLKPGLWEVTMQMPQMTPQLQAQMEKAGVKVQPGGGVAVQTCLTKEQVERDEPPKPRENARQKCERTEFKRAGSTANWKVVCTGERPMTGTGSMTMESPESYSSTMNMVSQDPKYGSMTMNNSMRGKWLSPDCPAPAKPK
jgi:hypothetical protein